MGFADSQTCGELARTHKWCGVWVFTADGKGLMSGSYDDTAKYWDVSLLGNRQGVSTITMVNEADGLPLLRSFLCQCAFCSFILQC